MTYPTPAALLLAASASVVFALGLAHLVFTFHGNKLHPRESSLMETMKADSPVLTRQTTMWKAWIGFNASHSLGALLFGLVFGYLALEAPGLFFNSLYLRTVGLALLTSYVFLSKRYWFSTPFRGIAFASALYVLALAASEA
ncbi:MAG: LIC_13387 family protein [Burkholderiales bacterium]